MPKQTIDVVKETCALLLVDIQPDFLPGGSLAVEDGDAILEPVGKLLESRRFGRYVATPDWHPPGHISFARSSASLDSESGHTKPAGAHGAHGPEPVRVPPAPSAPFREQIRGEFRNGVSSWGNAL